MENPGQQHPADLDCTVLGMGCPCHTIDCAELCSCRVCHEVPCVSPTLTKLRKQKWLGALDKPCHTNIEFVSLQLQALWASGLQAVMQTWCPKLSFSKHFGGCSLAVWPRCNQCLVLGSIPSTLKNK